MEGNSFCPLNQQEIADLVPCSKLKANQIIRELIDAVNVDESLLDEKGTLHLSDADLIAYSHGRYYGLGDFIGKFGYSVQKPSKTKSSRKKK